MRTKCLPDRYFGKKNSLNERSGRLSTAVFWGLTLRRRYEMHNIVRVKQRETRAVFLFFERIA